MTDFLPGVSRALLKRVREYSEETGVSVTDCIDEALQDWLDVTAQSRLDTLRSRKKPLAKVIHTHLHIAV